jgi:NAD(P) transhydrogenase subunit beta
MEGYLSIAVDVLIITVLMAGIWQFTSPGGARRGNLTAALAMGFAIALVLYRHGSASPVILALALAAGGAAGWILALRVNMIQIPAMIAIQNGAGALAAFLVSLVELMKNPDLSGAVAQASGLIGIVIGASTFSASLVAAGKLANVISQPPRVLPRHGLLMSLLVALIAAAAVLTVINAHGGVTAPAGALAFASLALGVLFAIRIGGADMPVVISFLNTNSGVAAAFCGIVIGNRLLIACGATVAASGTILTMLMCRAMNRNMLSVFRGISQAATGDDVRESAPSLAAGSAVSPETALLDAGKVIVVPGYGMAMAQAQQAVKDLYDALTARGAEVLFGIHPIAGRMPGHMNVLLAEVDIPYDRLIEMDEINREFSQAGVTIVVGACDVVNPAAISVSGTPLSGMPVLRVDQCPLVLVFNLDRRPGYSGVPNPLYGMGNVVMFEGNAAESVAKLAEIVRQAPPA